nr:globin-coupled sensor protein [Acetobacter sacchari]
MHDDIQRKLQFLGLGTRECDIIRSAQPDIMKAIPAGLDLFYEKILQVSELSSFFENSEHIKSAKGRQKSHWHSVTDAKFGSDYITAVTAIGNMHAKLGLNPGWYIAGYSVLLGEVVRSVIKDAWPSSKRSLFSAPAPKSGGEELGEQIALLIKVVLLDMDLAISTYLENLEGARVRAQEARIASLDTLASALDRVAEGDLLLGDYEALSHDGGRLEGAFANVINGLSEIILEVRHSSESVEVGAREIRKASEEVLQRISEQTTGPQSVCNTIGPLADSVKSVAQRAKSADAAVSLCGREARQSRTVVAETIAAVDQIAESCGKISQIIGLIEEIALQTNLLALNAGVEASRAGDAGRGFSVVAKEVRALAQRSAGAAKETRALITTIGEDVTKGVKLVNETGVALESISRSVVDAGGLVGEIAEAAEEQALRIDEINAGVVTLEREMRSNAAMMRRTTGVSHELARNSTHLMQLVMNFKVHDQKRRQRVSTGREQVATFPP